jgi:exopolyphosphatase/guanosine-5'-triphosphate,3'-diphosphate pyrophosphatase
MTSSTASQSSRDLEPIAVVDIGSNSVRLVVYEGAVRAPTPVFNEKIQCGLGKRVADDPNLPEESVERALKALARFHAVIRNLRAKVVRVIATAAVREAKNGKAFIRAAEQAIQEKIEILSGEREAELAAAGIRMGFDHPDGLAGDLGGGSLEIVETNPSRKQRAITLPLGALRLAGESGGNLSRAAKLVDKQFERAGWLANAGEGRPFYAVGGTFRSIAKLHMTLCDYPLRVMHAYTVDARAMSDFCATIVRASGRRGQYEGYDSISKGRRDLLPFGALVLQRFLARGETNGVVFSATGIREGLLYSLLSPHEQQRDALLAACADLADQRARSARHAGELKRWTDPLFGPDGIDETPQETRLREAACLISDIGWRGHPDYRAEQSLEAVANSALVGVDHPGRIYLAFSMFFRHSGISDPAKDTHEAKYLKLMGPRLLERARIIAAAVRTAHMISIGMPGVIDETCLVFEGGKLVLHLPEAHRDLGGERLARRLSVLARQFDLESAVTLD